MSQNIPLYQGSMSNNQKCKPEVSLQILHYRLFFDFQEKNFNIFTGYDNEPVISFDPSNTVHEKLQNTENEIAGCGVEKLSEICQQVREFRRMVST